METVRVATRRGDVGDDDPSDTEEDGEIGDDVEVWAWVGGGVVTVRPRFFCALARWRRAWSMRGCHMVV